MVQVNLLPDVKSNYLKTQQSKHTFVMGAVLVSVISLTFVGLLYAYVSVVQPRHLANLQTDIDTGLSKVKEVPEGSKMVTVQGALQNLPALQDQKTITSRLFGYINGFTPKDVSYTETKLDLTTGTLSLRGQTTDLEQANVLANNLKSAELSYKQGETTQTTKPFSKVVFTNLGRAEQSESGRSVSFQVDVVVDKVLFNQSLSDIKLKVNADSEELLLPKDKPFVAGGGQ